MDKRRKKSIEYLRNAMVPSIWAISSEKESATNTQRFQSFHRGLFCKALTDSLDVENENECIFFEQGNETEVVDLISLFNYINIKMLHIDQVLTCGTLLGSGTSSLSGIPMFAKSKKFLSIQITEQQLAKARTFSEEMKRRRIQSEDGMLVGYVRKALRKYYMNLKSFYPDENDVYRVNRPLSSTFVNPRIVEVVSEQSYSSSEADSKKRLLSIRKYQESQIKSPKVETSKIWNVCGEKLKFKDCEDNSRPDSIKIMIQGRPGIGLHTKHCFIFEFVTFFSNRENFLGAENVSTVL